MILLGLVLVLGYILVDVPCNPRTTVYTDYGKLISVDCTS